MNRRLSVARGNRSALIEPHGTTDLFRGTPLVGDWILQVDAESKAPPSRVLASFSLSCP